VAVPVPFCAGGACSACEGLFFFRVIDAEGEKAIGGDEQVEGTPILVATPCSRAIDSPSLFGELSLAQGFDEDQVSEVPRFQWQRGLTLDQRQLGGARFIRLAVKIPRRARSRYTCVFRVW
jgi:hypothetical protein